MKMPLSAAVKPVEEIDFTPVRNIIHELADSQDVSSIAIGVTLDGRIIWEEAYGLANREKLVKAVPQTLYSLASVTKLVTATAVMILAERGLIDIDKPINHYLTQAKIHDQNGPADQVTIRQVLNHTSGLPAYCHLYFENSDNPAPDIVGTIRDHAFLATRPGERYEYTNLGYGVLEHLVAEVSQRPFDDFVEKEIFLPLGMTHASMDVHPEWRHLEALRYDSDKRPLPYYNFDHRGASAMYADVHDMLLFGLFHLKAHLPNQRPILSDAAIDAMQRPDPNHPKTGPAVLGWHTYNHPHLGYIVEHAGGMPGVSTILTLATDHNIAIAVLANSRHERVHTLPADILECMMITPDAKDTHTPDSPGEKNAASPTNVTPEFIFPRSWHGVIKTPDGPIPVVIDMVSQENVTLTLGQSKTAEAMKDISFQKHYIFQAICSSHINNPAFRGQPHALKFELFLRDDGKRLEGSVSALSSIGSIPYWIALD